jgi:hypothetical protein
MQDISRNSLLCLKEPLKQITKRPSCVLCSNKLSHPQTKGTDSIMYKHKTQNARDIKKQFAVFERTT